jgi:hypothetical protein
VSVTTDDLALLERLAYRIRQDGHGMTPWDRHGTHVVFARELVGMHLPTALEIVTRNAADPEAKTPASITRKYLPTPVDPPKRGNHPPKKGDECPSHPGQWADSCGGCHADELARVYDGEASNAKPTPGWTAGNAETGAQACRAAIAEARS